MTDTGSLDRSAEFSGTAAVKDAHRFDPLALERFMLAEIRAFKGPLSVRQFKGGQSNPTYLLSDGGGRRYVLRRKPPGQLLRSAHAVDREYRVLSALATTPVPVPQTFCLCEDDGVIGTAFYIMEYLDGRVIWDPLKELSSAGERRQLFDAMNLAIASLHNVDHLAVGLQGYGKTEDYVARQLSRWSRQVLESPADEVPALLTLIDWLQANIPADNGEACIVHGDLRCDNMVFANDSISLLGILDWELSTLGHPVADFSYHCMQWRLPVGLFGGMRGLDLKSLGIPEEEQYMRMYCDATGRGDLPDWQFYMTYNLFRIAAIFHGIAGRVKTGTASSASAREMGALATPIAEFACSEIAAGRA